MIVFVESVDMDELEQDILQNKTEIDRLKASPQPYSPQTVSQLNQLEIEKLELKQKKADLQGKEESVLREKELSTSARNDLPDSAFVFPKDRKYPIPDENHARDALSRVSANGTDAEKKAVRAAVHKKFPAIEIGEGVSEDTGWL